MAGDISGTVQTVTLGGEEYQVYDVPVDYDLSHTQQIEEARFDWVTDYDNSLIFKDATEHLYSLPTGQVIQRITLVHLGRPAKKEVVLARMKELNVCPTLSPEFFALTKAFPDLQRQFSLVGIGSVWVSSDGYRDFLVAYGGSDERNLRLYWGDDGWRGHCRFPAVCKEIAP